MKLALYYNKQQELEEFVRKSIGMDKTWSVGRG